MQLRVFGVCFAMTILAPGVLAGAATLCDGPGPRAARVAAVDARLELTLDDGTRLGLAGLEPPLPTPDRPELDVTARDAVAAWLVGRPVTVRPLAARADRWGRIPALVWAEPPDGGAAESVAAAVLGLGLARFKPDSAVAACQKPWLEIEQAARTAHIGLWADPYYAVLRTTDDAGAFAERAGSQVLFEGVLRDVRAGGVRTTLLFEPREVGRRALAVTILQRKVVIFDNAGLSFRALIGRRLRVRGLLETRFGPHIEIANPDDIEVLAVTPKAADTAAAPQGEVR